MLNRNILNPMLYQNNIQPIGPGIYHNPTDGLISLSSDGINRITIADKNLGATQVYNDGDELTQANCGNYYQWGNNYGFPFSGSITTSSTKVDATNYGPYYESDTFITGHNDRSSIVNNNLRGNFFDYSSINPRQGPCPEGFVIPSAAYIFYDSSGLENIDRFMRDQFGRGGRDLGEAYQRYLKIPLAGALDTITGTKIPNTGGFWGCYGSLGTRTDKANYISLESGTEVSGYKSLGLNIRPVKENPVIPDETRTILYQDSPAGLNFKISHNPELGLITIWDGQYSPQYITIADKNLGATQVYNYGDELTQANCGNFYQRGNNYGFPFTGPTKTSTTQVDATNYGPYYNSRGTFVTGSDGWRIQPNQNLWGGVTNTKKAMQGPCNPGFHVGSRLEYVDISSIAEELGAQTQGVIKMPLGGYINGSGQIYGRGEHAYTRVSDYSPTNRGASIRPVKNEPVTPNSNRIKLL